jgi:hypothetical protein
VIRQRLFCVRQPLQYQCVSERRMYLPPCGSLTDRRVTGRRWRNVEEGQSRVLQVRPSTSGSIGSFVVDDAAPGDGQLREKLAALPQGTRARARVALALAHQGRVARPPPRRDNGFFSARTTRRENGTPRGPSRHHEEHTLPLSANDGVRQTVRPVSSGSSMVRPESSGSSMGRIPRASTLNGKQRLLVGRRAQTAQLLGMNSMRTLGAPIDPTSGFTLDAKVRYLIPLRTSPQLAQLLRVLASCSDLPARVTLRLRLSGKDCKL